MEFYEYDTMLKATMLNDSHEGISKLVFWTLGLQGEVGEVFEQIKRMYRDDNGVLTEDREKKIVYELGDALYYIAAVARTLGYTLQEVADKNAKKLYSRKERGVLVGDGSDR